MEVVDLRDGKRSNVRSRYRMRVISVFVLRMRMRRKVMLELSSCFAFSSVAVLIKAYKSIELFL